MLVWVRKRLLYIPGWCRLLGGRLQTDPHLCSVPTQYDLAESHSLVLYTHTIFTDINIQRNRNKQRRPSDQTHTRQCPHIHFLVSPCIYQACQSPLQCAVWLNLPVAAENVQLIVSIINFWNNSYSHFMNGNISELTTQCRTNLSVSYVQHYLVPSLQFKLISRWTIHLLTLTSLVW